MKNKYIILLGIFIFLLAFKTNAQFVNIKYKYDNANRLIQAIYTNQLTYDYTYDKDGNRTLEVISSVVTSGGSGSGSGGSTSTGNPTGDSTTLSLYPNPTRGTFSGEFYSTKNQVVTIRIISLTGLVIHTYTPSITQGFVKFTITLNPPPQAGTYIVTVQSADINLSGQLIIVP